MDHEGININNGGCKLTGMKQIAKLKEIIQKWQSSGPKAKRSQITNTNDHDYGYRHHRGCMFPGPLSYIRLMIADDHLRDDDSSGCPSPEPPADVPEGYLAVYVGPEHQRFIIPTTYLNHSIFKLLLKKVGEEFGFDHIGGLTIPCEIETFTYLLDCMELEIKEKRRQQAQLFTTAQYFLWDPYNASVVCKN